MKKIEKFLGKIYGVDLYADTDDPELLDTVRKFLDKKLGFTPRTAEQIKEKIDRLKLNPPQ